MLSDFLHSSYQTYKDDTDTIAKWLAVKAKQCGYPVDLLSPADPNTSLPQSVKPSGRLKGAARKQAKKAGKESATPSKDPSTPAETPKYTIKVKDFAALAECIARFDKPVVKVPATVGIALSRAIKLRSQHHAWSQTKPDSKASMDAEKSNESHAYFLGILERTREILKPRMLSDTIKDFLSQPSSSATGAERSEQQLNDQIGNMFDNLDIQEPAQSFLDAPDVERTPDVEAIQESNYEAEKLQSIEEQYMASHCLFQDLRSIRSFLRQLWANYRDGGLSLVSVSITTNTAMDFIRSMEQDILKHFPDKSDYESLVHVFYGAQCLHRGHDPSSKQHPDDGFNYEVYDLAEEVMLPTYIIVEALQRVISPNDIPVYKPGHFGFRDMRTNWTEKSDRDKVRDDSLVLMEAFADFMLMAMITSKWTLSEDELIRGVRQMVPDKPIPLWLVFAAQCFLDTQHVLGQDVARAHRELQQTGNAIRASIKQNLEFHKSLRIENWPRQNDEQFHGTLEIIEEWISKDLVADKLKKVIMSDLNLSINLTDGYLGQSRCDVTSSRAIPPFETVSPSLWSLLVRHTNEGST